jgi:sugar phosphate isomerase/epimerase
MQPKLALCNFLPDPDDLKALAVQYGFEGLDWSFDLETVPITPAEESRWAQGISTFGALEIRYHCPFYQLDLGHDVPEEANKAASVFRRIIRLVSQVQGRFLTIHIGLGHNSTEPLSWDATIKNLKNLVRYGAQQEVTVCLENLAWGWTSKPQLFEKLVRGSGSAVTFDIGHAQCCESVRSHYYSVEDFVTPHPDRVLNAHVYHEEITGLGHAPPGQLKDLEDRLDILRDIGCPWWTLEVRDKAGVLQTKKIVDEYLTQQDDLDTSNAHGSLSCLASDR